MNNLILRVVPVLLVLIYAMCCATSSVMAQTPGATPLEPKSDQIDSLYMNYQESIPGVPATPASATMPATPGTSPIGRYFILVFLSDPLADPALFTSDSGSWQDVSTSNVRITFAKSKNQIPAGAIEDVRLQATRGRKVIKIRLDYDYAGPDAEKVKPTPGDDEVEVTFGELHFKSKVTFKAVGNVTGKGQVYTTGNRDKLIQKLTESYKTAVASAKKTDEKNLLGVDVQVPQGGGKTEGNLDLNLYHNYNRGDHQTLFDNISLGLQLKKASEDKADLRHFSAGISFKKTVLFNRKRILAVRNAILNPALTDGAEIGSGDKQEQILEDFRRLQDDFVRGVIFDNGLRFEGDVKGASIGNVSNLLYDGQVRLAFVSKSFGNRTGFVNLSYVPVGFEGGYNLTNTDDPAHERSALARIKSGAEFILIFNSDNPNAFLNRVEFDMAGVDRYLFQQESRFDETTKKNILTTKGNKYYVQSDLKFFFGGVTPIGRAGIRVSFIRGSLPPVYAPTKTFNIGLILQQKDDDTAKEIKLK